MYSSVPTKAFVASRKARRGPAMAGVDWKRKVPPVSTKNEVRDQNEKEREPMTAERYLEAPMHDQDDERALKRTN